MLPEKIVSLTWSIAVGTDERTVTKAGTNYTELVNAINELYDDDLCPVQIEVAEDDPSFWDWDDDFDDDDPPPDRPSVPRLHEET